MSLDYNKIDAPIRHIVRWMNSQPGIETDQSCGGHKHPNKHQEGENDFFIMYYATPSAGVKVAKKIWLTTPYNFETPMSIGMFCVLEVRGEELFYELRGDIRDFEWMR